MHAYWDASAALALILEEPHSAAARVAAAQCTEATAWAWARVEIEAGVARRGGAGFNRMGLEAMLARISWIDLGPPDYAGVIALNRKHRLRAADAGHLFCLRRAARLDPGITLVCFDRELLAAARAEKLRVWSA